MILVRTSWFLCVVFLLTSILSSAITVVPGREVGWGAFRVLLILLSLGFGLAAVLMRSYLRKKPDAWIFKSKALARLYVGLAVLTALLCLLGITG